MYLFADANKFKEVFEEAKSYVEEDENASDDSKILEDKDNINTGMEQLSKLNISIE